MRKGEARRVRLTPGFALALWAALLVAANRGGQVLLDRGTPIRILAPPLVGRFRWWPAEGLSPLALGVPLVAGACLWAVRRGWPERLDWRRLLLVATGAAGAWAVALAVVSGWSGLARPMALPGHYLLDVPSVDAAGGPGSFLRTFTDQIDRYGVHVRAHPPGFLLGLWAMAKAGFGGAGWAAAVAVAGGAAAVPAVLMTVREVAGETVARRAAPFVAMAPAALYVASTADAAFAGVGAWAVAAVVLAVRRAGPRADLLAVTGGVLFGVVLMLSYGLVLLALVPLAVALPGRAWRPVVVAAAGAGAVLAAFALAGFWWPSGLHVTRREYRESVAAVRPYGYFLFANLAALGVIVGPATVAGLARLRSWSSGLGLIVAGAAAAVAVADISGLSKGEVERIWLPFAVWLLPAGAALASGNDRAPTGWLAAQAGLAVTVQLFVRTHW